jgi:hypothetical protein
VALRYAQHDSYELRYIPFQTNPKLLLLGLSDDALPTLQTRQHHTVGRMNQMSQNHTYAVSGDPRFKSQAANPLPLHFFVSFYSHTGKYPDSTLNSHIASLFFLRNSFIERLII